MDRWRKTLCATGALLFGLSIGLSAVGAHAVNPESASRWEAATLQLALNSLGLMVLGVLPLGKQAARLAGGAVVLGILLFSGSLIALTLTGSTQFARLAPAGGSLLIVAWTAVGLRLLLQRATQDH